MGQLHPRFDQAGPTCCCAILGSFVSGKWLILTSCVASSIVSAPAHRTTAVLQFAQDRGTEAMQVFVHQRQRNLKELVAEADAWGEAREQVRLENETEWDLVCRIADEACPHGEHCTYSAAAKAFFKANAASLCRKELAALRNIVLRGPSRTTRVPMLVGPTNSSVSAAFSQIRIAFVLCTEEPVE